MDLSNSTITDMINDDETKLINDLQFGLHISLEYLSQTKDTEQLGETDPASLDNVSKDSAGKAELDVNIIALLTTEINYVMVTVLKCEVIIARKQKEMDTITAKTYDDHVLNSNNQRWSFKIVKNVTPDSILNNPAIVAAADTLNRTIFRLANEFVILKLQTQVDTLQDDIINTEFDYKTNKDNILKSNSIADAVKNGLHVAYITKLRLAADIKRKTHIEGHRNRLFAIAEIPAIADDPIVIIRSIPKGFHQKSISPKKDNNNDKKNSINNNDNKNPTNSIIKDFTEAGLFPASPHNINPPQMVYHPNSSHNIESPIHNDHTYPNNYNSNNGYNNTNTQNHNKYNNSTSSNNINNGKNHNNGNNSFHPQYQNNNNNFTDYNNTQNNTQKNKKQSGGNRSSQPVPIQQGNSELSYHKKAKMVTSNTLINTTPIYPPLHQQQPMHYQTPSSIDHMQKFNKSMRP
jgi:hypothetical protein